MLLGFWLSPRLASQGRSESTVQVFKVNGDITTEQFEELARKIRTKFSADISALPVFTSYRLLVVKTCRKDGNLFDGISNLLSEVAPKSTLERIPVDSHQGRANIPTGIVMVQFKPGASQAMIEGLLRELNLIIVKIPGADVSGPLILRDRNGSVAKAVKAAAALKKSELVEYAELDFVEQSR
jgi:hypothetical protein